MNWSPETETWELTATTGDFAHVKRMELLPEVRTLLESASEVYRRLGPPKGYDPMRERLRSALYAMRKEGYVSENWALSHSHARWEDRGV